MESRICITVKDGKATMNIGGLIERPFYDLILEVYSTVTRIYPNTPEALTEAAADGGEKDNGRSKAN